MYIVIIHTEWVDSTDDSIWEGTC